MHNHQGWKWRVVGKTVSWSKISPNAFLSIFIGVLRATWMAGPERCVCGEHAASFPGMLLSCKEMRASICLLLSSGQVGPDLYLEKSGVDSRSKPGPHFLACRLEDSRAGESSMRGLRIKPYPLRSLACSSRALSAMGMWRKVGAGHSAGGRWEDRFARKEIQPRRTVPSRGVQAVGP